MKSKGFEIKLSQKYMNYFLNKLTTRNEWLIQQNYKTHKSTDKITEATLILSTDDPTTKDILTQHVKSYVNMKAIEGGVAFETDEGLNTLFNPDHPIGLGYMRIKQLEKHFKNSQNNFIEIKDPTEFQKKLNNLNKDSETEEKFENDIKDLRISKSYIRKLTVKIFIDSITMIETYEESFTKRSKKYKRKRFYTFLQGKEEQINELFFESVALTFETAD